MALGLSAEEYGGHTLWSLGVMARCARERERRDYTQTAILVSTICDVAGAKPRRSVAEIMRRWGFDVEQQKPRKPASLAELRQMMQSAPEPDME